MKYTQYHHIIKYALTIFLTGVCLWAYSIPFTGGDLSYKRIKNGVYEFTLVLEKDCNRFAPNFEFEKKVTVGAFNLRNELIGECGENGRIFLTLESVTKKTNNLTSGCIDTGDEECREIAVYKGIANVPISAYGYQFVYSECCRTENIKNIVDPKNTGFTLKATLTLNGYLWYTSTPAFSNNDPLYSCIGEENTFNPGIAPKQHEEYRYALCTPYDGATPTSVNSLPHNPPYDNVDYATGYSAQAPLGEDGEISIDPKTGVLTYTGNKAGSYAIAICVDQYKKGRLVGTNIHEIQLNFTDCEGSSLKADFDYTVDFCNLGRVSFENLSVGADDFEWTFYTDENTSTTSTNPNPVMTFPGKGSFVVELAVSNAEGCVDTARKVVEVYDFVEDIEVLNFGNCDNLSQDLSLNKDVRNYNINWFLIGEDGTETEIGSGAEITYTFPSEGLFDIRVMAEIEGCLVTATRRINVVQGVTVPMDTIALCSPDIVSLNPNAFARYHYKWNIDSLVEDVNDPNPRVFVSTTTLFPVTVTDKEDPDCTGEGFVLVTVGESILAEFKAVQDLCSEDGFDVTFEAITEGISNVHWTFVIGNETIESDEETPTINFPVPGYYNVALAGDTESGCSAAGTRFIEVFDPSSDLGIINFGNCENFEQVLKLDKPIEGYDITWTLIEEGTETEMGTGEQITYDFGEAGNYTVRADVSNPECSVAVTDLLVVDLGVTVPRDTIDIPVPGNVNLLPVYFEGYDYQWQNADLIEDVNNPNPLVNVTETTRFDVIVTHKDDPDCVDTGFVLVRVGEMEISDFNAKYDICDVDKTVGFVPVNDDLISTLWFFDANDPNKTSTENSPLFEYDAYGSYDVTLIAESILGFRDTLTKTIIVNDLFSFLDFNTNGGCEGLDYTLELNDPALGYEVNWYLDDAGDLTKIGEGVNMDFTFDAPGKYDIRVELVEDRCARSFVRTLQVTDGIQAPDTTIVVCEPGLIALNPFGRNDITYSWTPADNLDDASSYNPVASITENVTYQVTVEIQDGSSTCSSTGTVEVILDQSTDTIPFDTTTLTICEGDVVFLNEDGDSTFIYYWQPESFFEDSRVVNPSTRLFTSQTFTVTITNPETGCSNSFRKRVNVIPIDNVITIDYTFVCGETVATIIGMDIPDGGQVEWTYQDSVISTEPTFDYDFGDYGTFEVTARLVGDDCIESSALITLINPDEPLFSDTIYLCEPGTIVLNPEGDPNLIYTWIGPNLETNNVASPSAEVDQNSIYSAIIQHPDDTTCQTTGRVYVFIEMASDIISANKTEFCMGDTARLTVGNGGQPMNVQWSDPDGVLIGTEGTVEFVFEKMGEYSVIVDFRGCTFMDTINLQFRNAQIVASQTEGICPGDEVKLELQFNTEEPYDSIAWGPEDVVVSDVNPAMATYTPDSNSIVTAWVYFSDGCLSMDTVMLRIPPELADLTISADRDTVFRGQKATLTASDGGFTTYRWEPADFVDNPDQAETQVIPENTTTFTLTATDANGCAVQKSITIVVLNPQCEPPYVFVPRAFSPNGDGTNDILFVRGASIDILTFIVYDRWGDKMFETSNINQGWDGTHQGKPLPPDVYGYYLSVTCIGGDTYTEKGNVTIIR